MRQHARPSWSHARSARGRRRASMALIRTTNDGHLATHTEADLGTYRVDGTTLAFVSVEPEVGQSAGTVDGRRLTVRSASTVLVFQR